jgi:hypothetical protein
VSGVSFQIHRNDFVSVLNDAAIFASRDGSLPMICQIGLTITRTGLITASATDRFMLGRRSYQLPISGGGEHETAWAFDADGDSVKFRMPLADAARVGALHAKPPRGSQGLLDVEIASANKVTRLSIKSGGTKSDAEVTSVHTDSGMELPDLDKMIAASVPDESMVGASIDPLRLAVLAKVSRPTPSTPIRVRFCGASKPVRLEIGDRFVGLIMPMRDDS